MNQHSAQTKSQSLLSLRERDQVIAEAYLARSEFLAMVVANAIGGLEKAAHSLAHVFSHQRDGLAH